MLAKVPKASGGKLKLKASFSFYRMGTEVFVTGKMGGSDMFGKFEFLPKAGQDCFQTAITDASVVGQLFVGGS